MKFLLDVHLPVTLQSFLQWNGFDAVHVKDVLNGIFSSDLEISAFADSEARILITKDKDFKNMFFLRNTPQKVLRIVMGNSSNEKLIDCFRIHLKTISDFNQDRFYGEIELASLIFFSR